jgi:hypothetical protein
MRAVCRHCAQLRESFSSRVLLLPACHGLRRYVMTQSMYVTALDGGSSATQILAHRDLRPAGEKPSGAGHLFFRTMDLRHG